jgi:hypothetical protein
MARDYSTGFRLENEPTESGEDPVVSKKFRITIDVVVTLASGPQGGAHPRSPVDVSHTKELTERLLARPGILGCSVAGQWRPHGKPGGGYSRLSTGWVGLPRMSCLNRYLPR